MQKSPPRFVPTLTQMVAAKSAAKPLDVTLSGLAASTVTLEPPSAQALAQQLHQQLLVRTRQYLDIELQRRIREVVSQLALEHAHKLFEEIQPLLEATITQVVDEAVQQAVSHAAKPAASNAS